MPTFWNTGKYIECYKHFQHSEYRSNILNVADIANIPCVVTHGRTKEKDAKRRKGKEGSGMQGAARRAPAVQMGICAPRSVGPDGSALRGKPSVPINALPKARGRLLNASHKISDACSARTGGDRAEEGAVVQARPQHDHGADGAIKSQEVPRSRRRRATCRSPREAGGQ